MKHYKKLQFRFLLVLLLIQQMLFSCRSPVLESQWSNNQIVIDGDNSDWQAIQTHYVESRDVSIALANDGVYFYLQVSFTNPLLAMRFRANGSILQFTSIDSMKPILGLSYHGTDTLDTVQEPGDSFWQILDSEQKQQFMNRMVAKKSRITVTKDGQSQFIADDGSKGISAARIVNKDYFGYEFRIPLAHSGDIPYSLDLNPGESLRLGIGSMSQTPADYASSVQRGSGPGRNTGTANGNMEIWLTIKLAEINAPIKI